MHINKVAGKGEAANVMGVWRVGGLEKRDTQVIKGVGRGAAGPTEPLRVFLCCSGSSRRVYFNYILVKTRALHLSGFSCLHATCLHRLTS